MEASQKHSGWCKQLHVIKLRNPKEGDGLPKHIVPSKLTRMFSYTITTNWIKSDTRSDWSEICFPLWFISSTDSTRARRLADPIGGIFPQNVLSSLGTEIARDDPWSLEKLNMLESGDI